jgi:hypothetical protein
MVLAEFGENHPVDRETFRQLAETKRNVGENAGNTRLTVLGIG